MVASALADRCALCAWEFKLESLGMHTESAPLPGDVGKAAGGWKAAGVQACRADAAARVNASAVTMPFPGLHKGAPRAWQSAGGHRQTQAVSAEGQRQWRAIGQGDAESLASVCLFQTFKTRHALWQAPVAPAVDRARHAGHPAVCDHSAALPVHIEHAGAQQQFTVRPHRGVGVIDEHERTRPATGTSGKTG